MKIKAYANHNGEIHISVKSGTEEVLFDLNHLLKTELYKSGYLEDVRLKHMTPVVYDYAKDNKEYELSQV